jgi:hypothetical protein
MVDPELLMKQESKEITELWRCVYFWGKHLLVLCFMKYESVEITKKELKEHIVLENT